MTEVKYIGLDIMYSHSWSTWRYVMSESFFSSKLFNFVIYEYHSECTKSIFTVRWNWPQSGYI